MKTQLLTPSASNLDIVAQALKEGNIVAFPTETVYGMGVAASAPISSIERIYSLKNRSASKPLGIYLPDTESIYDYLPSYLYTTFSLLASSFIPGPLTLVFPQKSNNKSIAIRISSDPVLTSLLNRLQQPILGTSANLSDQPSAVNALEVLTDFPRGVSYIVNGGHCSLGAESTILSLDPLCILRRGVIPNEELESVLGVSLPWKETIKEDSFGIRIRIFTHEKELQEYLLNYPSISRKVYSNFATQEYYSILREAVISRCEEILFMYNESSAKFFPPLSRSLYPNRFFTRGDNTHS